MTKIKLKGVYLNFQCKASNVLIIKINENKIKTFVKNIREINIFLFQFFYEDNIIRKYFNVIMFIYGTYV